MFGAQIKNLKFWDQNYQILDIFGLEFENDIVMFEINTLKFVSLPYLDISGLSFKKLLSYLKLLPTNLS